MAVEIERKFLVIGDEWKESGTAKVYRQGYINRQDRGNTVRIRQAGERGYITIKGKTQGIARAEFEYEIPLADTEDMLKTICDRPLIEKLRYRIPAGDVVWEVDEFKGDNEGLVIAEVELDHPDRSIVLPHWIGKEVTGDVRYYNINLMQRPYKDWTDR